MAAPITQTKEIITFAFISRLVIIIFQIVSNNLIPDHNADAFDPPRQQENDSIYDSFVRFCFGGFRRWDAVYFTHIAEYGYTYENCVAFFPLYPLIVSLFSRSVLMFGVLHQAQSVLLIAVMINSVLFSLTARNLYYLGIETGLDSARSLLSVIVFCINPASIFMTAPYSETLYFYLLTLSLRYHRRKLYLHASIVIAFSIATRSNGLVGIGFVLYGIMQDFIQECFFCYRKQEKGNFAWHRKFMFLTVRYLIKIIICLTICLSTFAMYQYYIYLQFCSPKSPNSIKSLSTNIINYGSSQGYKLVTDNPSPWCFQTIPISYSYIQAKHWGVGFLKYYQLKQIPNFLLATPVAVISLCACVFFFKMNKEAYNTFGLLGTEAVATKTSDTSCHQGKSGSYSRDKKSILGVRLVVHVVHLASLTLFGCCFIHIQVLTRLLLSSSPLMYWYSGFLLARSPQVYSHVQHLMAGSSDSDSDHKNLTKLFGNVVSRSNLTRATRNQSGLNSGVGLWRPYLTQLSNNVCIKIMVFLLSDWSSVSWEGKTVLLYCIVYVTAGTVMFSNFLPWT